MIVDYHMHLRDAEERIDHPDPGFLSACRRRGVPITLASDAHRPELVGDGLDEALARSVGYETLTVFEARRSRQEPLG